MEGHKFLVEIVVVKFYGLAFEAVGFEAEGDEKVAGFSVGEYDGEIDVFEVGWSALGWRSCGR